MANICLLGHSFVSGLHHHMSVDHPLSPQEVSHHLKLNHLVKNFHLIGKRGSQIMNSSFSLPHELLTDIQPALLFLQYGSNDLAAGREPLEVATKVVDISRELLQFHSSIKKVAILSALPRGHSAWLNDSIQRYNGYIKNYCEIEDQIFYKTLQGFWTSDICTWSRDTIHPNTVLGRKKYKNALRRVTFAMLPRLS